MKQTVLTAFVVIILSAIPIIIITIMRTKSKKKNDTAIETSPQAHTTTPAHRSRKKVFILDVLILIAIVVVAFLGVNSLFKMIDRKAKTNKIDKITSSTSNLLTVPKTQAELDRFHDLFAVPVEYRDEVRSIFFDLIDAYQKSRKIDDYSTRYNFAREYDALPSRLEEMGLKFHYPFAKLIVIGMSMEDSSAVSEELKLAQFIVNELTD